MELESFAMKCIKELNISHDSFIAENLAYTLENSYTPNKFSLTKYKYSIYMNLATFQKGKIYSNIYNLYILFKFILTNDCLEMLSIPTDIWKMYRINLTERIIDFKIDGYRTKEILNDKKLIELLDELLKTLEEVKDILDSDMKNIPRRSDRLKQEILKKRNEDFKKCGCILCNKLYYDLTYAYN